MTTGDEQPLRRAFDFAREAGARGDGPFGAVLVDPTGQIVAEASNTATTDRDVTAHAETNLVRLVSARFEPQALGGYTMYASAEPCAMCAAAVYWSGIGRIVFGLSNARLNEVRAATPPPPRLNVGCRDVLAKADRRVEIIGPMLEDEAAEAVRPAS